MIDIATLEPVTDEQLVEKFIAYLDDTDQDRKINLRELRKTYGYKTAPKGRDQWGTVNHLYSCGAGVKFVSCSGHGGFLISNAHELCIDEPLRRCGQYEEDCDFNIVAAYFPKTGLKFNPEYRTTEAEWRKYAVESIIRWSRKDAILTLANNGRL